MTAKERLATLAEIGVEPVIPEPKTVLARLESMDLPAFVLPTSTVPHRPAVTEEGSEAANELESLVPLALDKYREVLLQPACDDLDLLKLQVATAANVINATLKVDEGRLKRRKLDILPKLLEIISQEERTMAGKLIEAA